MFCTPASPVNFYCTEHQNTVDVRRRKRKTNKVGEVLIVPIQVPRGDKVGEVLIVPIQVPRGDKVGEVLIVPIQVPRGDKIMRMNSENSECITQEVITFWDKWEKITYCRMWQQSFTTRHLQDID